MRLVTSLVTAAVLLLATPVLSTPIPQPPPHANAHGLDLDILRGQRGGHNGNDNGHNGNGDSNGNNGIGNGNNGNNGIGNGRGRHRFRPLISLDRASDSEKRVKGRYIVRFKEGRGGKRKEWAGRLGRKAKGNLEAFNGFVADLDEDALEELLGSENVEAVAEDTVVFASDYTQQTDAPWGLGRIDQWYRQPDQNAAARTFDFRYDERAGEGVDVYILDTGVKTDHQEFGGRASFGASYVGTTHQTDMQGHGTHCAGTVAGSTVGVAKKASIISVQVLGDDGTGSSSSVISGLDFVLERKRATGRPTVASLSLGGPGNVALDSAIARLTSEGVHVVVAAGNANKDASELSPARAPSAITVGATTIGDRRAPFSNYGGVVDIWAPGHEIISTWITSTTALASLSGTSMAGPHVAGAVAYLIAREGNISPADMAAKLKTLSDKNAISDIPSGTTRDFLFVN